MVIYGVSVGVLGAEQWISKGKEKRAAAKEVAKEAEAQRLAEVNEENQWQEFRRLNERIVQLQERVTTLEEAEPRRRRWW